MDIIFLSNLFENFQIGGAKKDNIQNLIKKSFKCETICLIVKFEATLHNHERKPSCFSPFLSPKNKAKKSVVQFSKSLCDAI